MTNLFDLKIKPAKWLSHERLFISISILIWSSLSAGVSFTLVIN